jgi:hypothetical protein
MQLIQIGETQTTAPETLTIQQMFLQLAEREAQMIRECLAKVEAHRRPAVRLADFHN